MNNCHLNNVVRARLVGYFNALKMWGRWGPPRGGGGWGTHCTPFSPQEWGLGVSEHDQRNHHKPAAPELRALPKTKMPHKILLVLLEADFERNQRKKVLTTSECPVSFVFMTLP